MSLRTTVESWNPHATQAVILLFIMLMCSIGSSACSSLTQDEMKSATPNAQAAGPRSLPAPKTVAARVIPPVIIIGFVGGFIKHDNLVHSEVQLAARLRQGDPLGVTVETFESYRGGRAHKKVLQLLDRNHDGDPTLDEKRNARIIIYGHSWGGAEAIGLARKLERDGIPVLLTIQVDSISKSGRSNAIVPANVAQAANFYQPNGFFRGQSEIRAADPTRTKILGNFRFEYKASSYDCADYPWYDRVFAKAHTQIECDPRVWQQVESLIRAYMRPTTGGESGQ